ncbi:MAG: hypothetical protein QNJ54_21320 [Prochloraceae cyanobacterium]|nr:hypothetical protein [Prochloraceae cyanobacterium]
MLKIANQYLNLNNWKISSMSSEYLLESVVNDRNYCQRKQKTGTRWQKSFFS